MQISLIAFLSLIDNSMVKIREYSSSDKMISLIANDYRILQVLSRFGIPLGFNDKTILEVCGEEGVDCDTFLTVVNFLKKGETDNPAIGEDEISHLSLESLLLYLKQSHQYFLNFYLPSIRRKLLDSIRLNDADVSFLIVKLFDEYVDGIREHMEEEERCLFPVVEKLIVNGKICEGKLPLYSNHHQEVGSKLRELKNIIIKYCPPDASANLLNAALYDIYRCEEELTEHCRIEDFLLIPAVKAHFSKCNPAF